MTDENEVNPTPARAGSLEAAAAQHEALAHGNSSGLGEVFSDGADLERLVTARVKAYEAANGGSLVPKVSAEPPPSSDI